MKMITKKFLFQLFLFFVIILNLIVGCMSRQKKEQSFHQHILEAKKCILRSDFDNARKHLDKAERLFKRPVIYYLRGNIEANQRNYDRAIEYYNKAIEIDSSYIEAYINRGRMWSSKGDNYRKCLDYIKAEDLGARNLYEETKFCREQIRR